ncbi:MAG: hypothetical protein KDC80_03545 [Saprospiraceae bacterium]|nr:hypothetical protein [Saprospiraceae bacterium]
MWKSSIKAGVIAGSLDISAAFFEAYLTRDVMPGDVLKFIASGILGDAAFQGGFLTMLLGLLSHYMIAIICSDCFYLFYRPFSLQKISWAVNALLIAIIAWIVTNQLIIPFSHIGPRPFEFSNFLVSVSILLLCVGVPIAIFARNYFKTT